MKLVINKCYGGFGVSIAAMKEMLGKCEHVKAHDPIEYFGSAKKWDDARREIRDFLYFDERGWPIYDEHRDARDCPVLIKTLIELGTKVVSSSFSRLELVDIPDGVAYEIDEYDGIEHIAEKHRTWG